MERADGNQNWGDNIQDCGWFSNVQITLRTYPSYGSVLNSKVQILEKLEKIIIGDFIYE